MSIIEPANRWLNGCRYVSRQKRIRSKSNAMNRRRGYPGSDVARSNKVRGTSQATRAGSENVLQEDKSLNWQENS